METNHLKRFDEIAKQICDLHRKKDAVYGNSFGKTFKRLGIISAVTRISDKYNRLEEIAINPSIDTLGESIEDTLKDLAAYAIMTLVELEDRPKVKVYTSADGSKLAVECVDFTKIPLTDAAPDKTDETVVKSDDETKVTEHYQVKPEDLKGDIAGFPIEVVQRMVDYQVEQGNEANVTVFQNRIQICASAGGFDWVRTEEGREFWGDVIVNLNFDRFFYRYPKSSTNNEQNEKVVHYRVKPEDLKGAIEGFPIEVVQRMVDCQVEQSNKADVEIFQKVNQGGFLWDKTKEGHKFWNTVIKDKNFELFFYEYPKKEESL